MFNLLDTTKDVLCTIELHSITFYSLSYYNTKAYIFIRHGH